MRNIITSIFLPVILVGLLVLSFSSLTFEDDERTYRDYVEYKKEKKKEKKPTFGQPNEAMRWFYEQRAYPLGKIPEGWRQQAKDHIQQHNVQDTRGMKSVAELEWTQHGPGNIGGRIRSILVNPNNNNIMYIGAVSGGIWKTTNGGSSWFALHDQMENLAVTTMVFHPNDPNTIYAGTGEGFFNYDAVRGEGIFKSTNGGASWTQLSATKNQNFHYVNKLIYDEVLNVLWVGTRYGVFFSQDNGETFNSTTIGPSGTWKHCMDIELAKTNPRTVYASFGQFNDSEIWRSTDSGQNWGQVSTFSGMGRIEMAVGESNPNYVYAAMMDQSDSQIGRMLRSSDAGSTWYDITIPDDGEDTYVGSQGWYNNIIKVKPTDHNVVYAGGIDLYRSDDAGQSWTRLSEGYISESDPRYVHVDQHYIEFDPANSNTLFVGNDGGIYKSTNSGNAWSKLNNNLHITQFYYGAVDPQSNKFYGGTQDNGTLKSDGSDSWYEILGGDGGAVEVDFNDPNTIFMETQNFTFFRSTNGGATFSKKMDGIPLSGSGFYDGTSDRTSFITPFSMDPNNSNSLVAGTFRIYRTTDSGENWTSISNDLTGDGYGSSGAEISTVIVAKGNSNVIYAGCSNGVVQVTTNGGANWMDRSSGLPDAYCTRIATDPTNPAVAYTTFSGFLSGQKVFKTTNYGSSWSNISSNLPNIPVSAVLVNPDNSDQIVVGTDLGVFVTDNSGGSWTQQNNGMANVVVMDLDYRALDKKVFAATHGRGMFSAQLGSGTGPGDIYSDLQYDDGQPESGYYWSTSGTGSANRLTPLLGGGKLVAISIYITSVYEGEATYQPVVLEDNNGQPGSDMVSLPSRTFNEYPGWDEIDVSGYNLMVSDDFYVGIIYDGVNKPSYGYDSENNGRAWDYDGSSWSSWTETYFMRARILTSTGEIEIDNTVPTDYALHQNFPNPFNPTTTISYALPQVSDVSLIIYDVQGNMVAELVNNSQSPGNYKVTWNGKNKNGAQVSSGMYIYRLQADDFVRTKKMMFVK